MLHVRLLALIGIAILAGIGAVRGSALDGAIESAAVAPYADFAHKDATSFCEDFVPSVAEKLLSSIGAGRDCVEAASGAFADYDVLVGPEPVASVRTVYARLGRAWVELGFGRGRMLRLALRRVDGRWRVSSSMFVLRVTCPGASVGPCQAGSKVLLLATIESGEIGFIPSALRRSGGRELRQYEAGRSVAAQSGCLACHRIGEDGNNGPGPDLTEVGARLDDHQLAEALINPRAPMPSFKRLPRAKFAALIRFLALLR